MLFSKKHIRDIEYRKDIDYIKAKISYDNTNINIILVHTVSPISQNALDLRNKQLNEICKETNKLNDKNIVLMGDLNLSNWSGKYKEFLNCMNLINNAKDKGINFTWSGEILKNLPQIHTHIDHAFVSKDINLLDYKVYGKYQSDHNLIFFRIKI